MRRSKATRHSDAFAKVLHQSVKSNSVCCRIVDYTRVNDWYHRLMANIIGILSSVSITVPSRDVEVIYLIRERSRSRYQWESLMMLWWTFGVLHLVRFALAMSTRYY